MTLRGCLRWIAALAGAMCALGAFGQGTGLQIEPSSEPLSCLISVRPQHTLPDYPASAAPGAGAVVRVKLKFSGSDIAPESQVVFNNATEAFAATVREHVGSYRLPCLAPGESFTGVQEFQFKATSPLPAVIGSATRSDERERSLPEGCLAGATLPPPSFPTRGSSSADVGVVVVRFSFSAPDQPPESTILFGQRRLAQAVLAAANGYRLPCASMQDKPIIARQTFHFRYEGVEVPMLPPELTLAQLLGSIKGLSQQKARFDFTTMGCPLKISFELYQPYANNAVHEIDDHNPGRREFIEWLSSVTLELSKSVERHAIGSQTKVSVPCALLDLSS